MHQAERHRRILQILDREPAIHLRDLMKQLGASEATVRRDLSHLSSQGAIRRFRGGAEPLDPETSGKLYGQPRFVEMQQELVAEKHAIAQEAAKLCTAGDSLIMAGGTSTYALAEAIGECGVNVLTNALHHAEVLLRSGKNRVLLLGGELIGEQGVIVSPFRWTEIEAHFASKIFLGAQAIKSSGILQTDNSLAHCERKLIAQAERVIVLADSSKFSKTAPVVVAALEMVDVLVTDSGIDPESLAMLEAADVEVIVAGSKPAMSLAG